jgi:hypothetical protein
MDSVVFDLCRGPGTVAQVVCSRSRASIERSSKRPKKIRARVLLAAAAALRRTGGRGTRGARDVHARSTRQASACLGRPASAATRDQAGQKI